MKITDDIVHIVHVTIKSWQRAAKGIAPPGSTWEDLEQDSYVKILEDQSFDPARGDLGPRVNHWVAEAIRAAYRNKLPITNWFNRDEESAQTPDVPVESDAHIVVDAEDFVGTLRRDDKEALERYKNHTPAPRNSPQRRRDNRRIKHLKDKVTK